MKITRVQDFRAGGGRARVRGCVRAGLGAVEGRAWGRGCVRTGLGAVRAVGGCVRAQPGAQGPSLHQQSPVVRITSENPYTLVGKSRWKKQSETHLDLADLLSSFEKK